MHIYIYVYVYIVISNGQKSFSRSSINTLSRNVWVARAGNVGWARAHGKTLSGAVLGAWCGPAWRVHVLPSLPDPQAQLDEFGEAGFMLLNRGGMCPTLLLGWASQFPQSPACPFSSVLMSIAPLFSLSAFGRGNFAFPLLLESTELLEKGSFNPKGHVWPLLSPNICRIGDRSEGSFQVLAFLGDLDQPSTHESLDGGWMNGYSSGAPCKSSCVRKHQHRARGFAFLQQRHTWGGWKGSQQQPAEGQAQPDSVPRVFQDYAEMLWLTTAAFLWGTKPWAHSAFFFSLTGM